MSPRWFIGLLMLFIINTVVSNILEQQNVLTTAQMSTVQQTSQMQLTDVKDPSIGGSFTSGAASLQTWLEILQKAFTSDYSFFYTVNYGMTQVQCTAASGEWNAVTASCQYPNEFMILRYIFYWPLTAAIAFFLILTLIQVIRGG